MWRRAARTPEKVPVGGVLSWLPLSYNFAMADLALHEYTGIVRYHVYNAMGWNVQATKPGAW